MAPPQRTRPRSADAAANESVKKVKTNSFAAQRTITVLVDSDATAFYVHPDFLLANSTVIERQIGDYDPSEESKPVIIRDVATETFDTFTKWIYDKKPYTEGIPMDNPEDISGASDESGVQWDSNLSLEDRMFTRLVDAFIFAARYDCTNFRKAVMLQVQGCIYGQKVVPSPVVVKRAVDYLGLESPLCRYIIFCYSKRKNYDKITKAHLSILPSEFFVAVLDCAFWRDDKGARLTVQSWCEFHEHEDEMERTQCENDRLNRSDPK